MSLPVTPLLTVDIIIELPHYGPYAIVLIERHYPPLGWAFPGGFVDVGERLEDAALREAYEETCLKVQLSVLLGCYSDPKRDARGHHTVSATYIATASGEPRAQDDAKTVEVVDARALSNPLVFDHRVMLDDYLRYRETGRTAPLRVAQPDC